MCKINYVIDLVNVYGNATCSLSTRLNNPGMSWTTTCSILPPPCKEEQ